MHWARAHTISLQSGNAIWQEEESLAWCNGLCAAFPERRHARRYF